jgi:hypothetical protein
LGLTVKISLKKIARTANKWSNHYSEDDLVNSVLFSIALLSMDGIPNEGRLILQIALQIPANVDCFCFVMVIYSGFILRKYDRLYAPSNKHVASANAGSVTKEVENLSVQNPKGTTISLK